MKFYFTVIFALLWALKVGGYEFQNFSSFQHQKDLTTKKNSMGICIYGDGQQFLKSHDDILREIDSITRLLEIEFAHFFFVLDLSIHSILDFESLLTRDEDLVEVIVDTSPPFPLSDMVPPSVIR